MKKSQLLTVVVIAALIAAFFASGGHRYLTFENLKQLVASAQSFYQAHPIETAVGYSFLYVVIAGLSLPGAVPMTLVGGAVFGLLWGTVIVSFASTLGATIAFLVSRLLLREWVQNSFARYMKPINAGIEKEGAFYLFTLRLIPQIPFFAINLVMGLVPIRTWTFYWVSQLGMLAGTIVYVNAGTQLAAIATTVSSWLFFMS